MAHYMGRRSFVAASGLAGMALLGACSGNGNGNASGTGTTGSSSAASSATQSTAQASAAAGSTAAAITVGTLATEDLLPLWVAQAEGLFDDLGLAVDIVPFQSATELISGVASGEVNLAMTDIMVTASMFASGVDVSMQWVTLGADPSQGRFGIMVGPDSDVKTLNDLAGVPIGVGSNTILEYVMDKLMEAAGIPADKVVVEEIQKLPVRYQAMASGEVAAAALPGSLLALGEANGCKLVADDTKGENLSQSVMIARNDFLADGAALVDGLKEAWNMAVELVNADPEAYRTVLVESANLPDAIAGTYPVSTYPAAALPTASMVDPVLEWMEGKGYLTQPVTYDEKTGAFATK